MELRTKAEWIGRSSPHGHSTLALSPQYTRYPHNIHFGSGMASKQWHLSPPIRTVGKGAIALKPILCQIVLWG